MRDCITTSKGAKAYFEAQDPKNNLPPVAWETVGFKALDDYTIRVELSGACSYLLDLMAFPTFFPLHEKSMAEFASGRITRRSLPSRGWFPTGRII